MSKTLQLHSAMGNGVIPIVEIANYGIVQAAGLVVPSDATRGYAPGCTFHHLDGGDGTAFYVNEGTFASCDFNAVNP
jgi:hypothetical protein